MGSTVGWGCCGTVFIVIGGTSSGAGATCKFLLLKCVLIKLGNLSCKFGSDFYSKSGKVYVVYEHINLKRCLSCNAYNHAAKNFK